MVAVPRGVRRAGLTALSYLELVTRHPQAAGAALFVHKAFDTHFLTFLVAFAVVCSGITSASTSSGLVASNLLLGLDGLVGGVPTGTGATLAVAIGFMLVLAVVNLRGVGESVKLNVVLTSVVVVALAAIIAIGAWAAVSGEGDLGRVVVFETPGEKSAFLAITIATTVAFFAMVGFEDSVNMVEEVKDPARTFPRILLTGLGICAGVYVLVALAVVVVIPPGDIADPANPDAGILLDVVRVGAPGLPIDDVFPFLTICAVGNTALINMLMASRLVYGMAKQDVLPRSLAAVPSGSSRSCGCARRPRWSPRSPAPRACCWRCSPSSTSPAWCCAGATAARRTASTRRAGPRTSVPPAPRS